MDPGVVSGLLRLAIQGEFTGKESFSLSRRYEQKARHRKQLQRHRRSTTFFSAPLNRSARQTSSGSTKKRLSDGKLL
jgi:hypothetical protein